MKRDWSTYLGIAIVALIVVMLGKIVIFGNWKSFDWNQKLTVTVETPEGERTGYGIVNNWVSLMTPCQYSGMSQMCVQSAEKGEATIIELPDHRYLFVLLPDNARYLAQDTFKSTLQTRKGSDFNGVEEFYAMLQNYREPGEVPRDAYKRTRFVTFDDLSDPLSVKLVDPDDLAATFGPGYALKSVTLELTGESPKYGSVEALLPWFSEYSEKHFRLNGEHCVACPVRSDSLADLIGTGVFSYRGR